jgi:hypothetical protein
VSSDGGVKGGSGVLRRRIPKWDESEKFEPGTLTGGAECCRVLFGRGIGFRVCLGDIVGEG